MIRLSLIYHIVQYIKEAVARVGSKLGGRRMPNTPEYIVKIVQDIEQSKTRADVYKILDDAVEKIPGFETIGTTVFVKDNFQFQCTMKENADRTDFEAMKRAYPHLESVRKIDICDSGMTVVFSRYKTDGR